MDLQQLVAVLAGSMSPVAEERKAAEAMLQQHQTARGQIVNLFRLSLEDSVDPAIRQIAAISFKNVAKKSWEATDKAPSPLVEEDKAAVRDNLLEAIARAPPNVRSQHVEAMKLIVNSDWPEQWPSLLPQVQHNLASSDQLQVAAALRVLRVLARKYEFKDEEERTNVLYPLVNSTFPFLLTLLDSLIKNDSPAVELAEMIKLSLKTFWSAIYMDVPPLLLQDDQFNGWMHAVHALLLRPVPVDHMPEDLDARKNWPWWKMKKWVMHIAYRLFNRYGDPNLCREKNDQLFAAKFRDNVALPFLNGVLTGLSELAQGKYITPRVTNSMLSYVTEAMAHKHTWKAMKPHIGPIVLNVIFPQLCFNDEDEELWQDDPQEYVRKGYDIVEDIYSTKTAAMSFIHTLCKARSKENLDMIMGHILTVLNEFKAAGPNAPTPLARKVDGALLAIGTLSDILTDKSRYSTQLEPMLLAHVAPLFESPHGHLRAKAAWLSGVFAEIKFVGGKGKGQTFLALLERVVHALNDVDLPVRVDAAVSIRNFLDAVEDEDLPALQPLVPTLLERFLSISQETDSTEDLTFSLEAVVERFGADIAPYAVGVMTALSEQFWRIIAADAEGGDDDDDDDVGPLGAYSVLQAMSTVLESVSSVTAMFPQMEEILFPIMDRYCSSDGSDVFEEIAQLITCITYFGAGISPRMWTLYPKLLAALDDWAVDFFDSVIMPLDNYISRGTEVFLTHQEPNLLEMTNRSLEKALIGDFDADESLACAPKLMGVILQHCKGRVDNCIGPYITLALSRLPRCREDEKEMKDALLMVIADALYYNPVLATTYMNQAGCLEQGLGAVLQAIFETKKNGKMKHFPMKRDKKILVLGLSSLLTVPDAALPPGPSANEALSRVASATVRVLLALKAQEDKLQSFIEDKTDSESGAVNGATGGESGNESESEEESDDDGDVLDEAAIERLRKKAMKRSKLVEDDLDDWSSDEEYWSDEEDDVQSPIDALSPYIFFAEALQAVQGANPQRFGALMGMMDAGVQAAIQGMMQYAVELRAAQAAAAAAGGVQ